MTEQQQSPQAGIAGALTDLSEQTRILVRGEIASAQRETWDKLKATAPALGLLGGAGVLGLAASASAYRASLRLLERWLPPSGAALLATVVYGGGAAAAGMAGLQQLRTLPVPFPAETVAETGAVVEETAAQVRRGAADATVPRPR
ncbi:phage holin family protein [Actinomycetospora cinnamomea]|uniref:Putative superfamily III holin-X n=1 Tax=Actinomycetospora cinnamomea TaxID=663609 RepID=A0A2U1F3Z8_9PSEU|nr:phage holin family protein [Actinomycetospora cinnamomea]PVZ06896.1 putative superfamily III holin-X [Actinomycetospora cinnamomea]